MLNVHITAETLPDGKMYFNIADRVLNETLKNNYSLVSDYTEGVQTRLNQQPGLKLRAQRPDFDQDRVKGFVNKLSSADDFTDVQWVLGDPMVNFTQSVVDEAIKKNAKFYSDAGMKSVIKRQVKGKACKWCRGLEGTYDYPKGTPNEVFHRHENCRCVTEYYPSGKKKKQDVWSKDWSAKKTKIKERENTNVKEEVGRQKARKLIRIAKNSEKQVTKDLLEISEKLGTEMVGLDFRLKSEDSLTRKVLKEPNNKMRDVLRYTNISSPDTQVSNYFKMTEELNKRGYNISKVKNYWNNPDNPYNGVNINLITPDNYEFELQFHTAESFELKNGQLHKLYEESCVLDEFKDAKRIIELDKEMFKLSNNLTRPTDIDKIR